MASPPHTAFKTPRALAEALRDYAQPDQCPSVSLLPFNRFSPDETNWWLCPKSDNPAYHLGKFTVKRTDHDEDLFVGIGFEKGVGPTAAEFFKATRFGKAFITGRTWQWHKFLESLSNGTFDRYVNMAQQAAGIPVTVIISVGMMKPPEPTTSDEDRAVMRDRMPRQRLYFACDEGKLTLVQETSGGGGLLTGAGTCDSLPGIAQKLTGMDRIDWHWMDAEFGFLLTNDPGATTWDSGSIWQSCCGPFLDWFR